MDCTNEWRTVCHEFLQCNPRKVITKFHFNSLFSQAQLQSVTPANFIVDLWGLLFSYTVQSGTAMQQRHMSHPAMVKYMHTVDCIVSPDSKAGALVGSVPGSLRAGQRISICSRDHSNCGRDYCRSSIETGRGVTHVSLDAIATVSLVVVKHCNRIFWGGTLRQQLTLILGEQNSGWYTPSHRS